MTVSLLVIFCGFNINQASLDHSALSLFRAVRIKGVAFELLFKEIKSQLEACSR
jgi:IS5 family transposase